MRQRQVPTYPSSSAAVVIVASMQLGCSDAVGDGCGAFEFTEEEAKHACVHVPDGPYGDLADGGDLVNLHMLYTVALTSAAGQYEANLTFTARESAVHAFVLTDDVPLQVLSGDAELCVGDDEPNGCDDYVSAHLVRLERQQQVNVRIGPTSKPSIRLLAERQ